MKFHPLVFVVYRTCGWIKGWEVGRLGYILSTQGSHLLMGWGGRLWMDPSYVLKINVMEGVWAKREEESWSGKGVWAEWAVHLEVLSRQRGCLCCSCVEVHLRNTAEKIQLKRGLLVVEEVHLRKYSWEKGLLVEVGWCRAAGGGFLSNESQWVGLHSTYTLPTGQYAFSGLLLHSISFSTRDLAF